MTVMNPHMVIIDAKSLISISSVNKHKIFQCVLKSLAKGSSHVLTDT